MSEDIIYIDSDNLENIVKLLNVYIREEINIISDYNRCNDEIKSNYKSKNSDLLEKIQIDSYNNLKTVLINHQSNIFLVNKRIDNVKMKFKKLKEIEDSTKIDGIM